MGHLRAWANPRPCEQRASWLFVLRFLKKNGLVNADVCCDDLLELKTLDPAGVLNTKGLAHVARLYNLEEILLSSREMTDRELAHLQNLESLRELDLTGSRVSDTGLERIAGFAKLEKLELDLTGITDTGLVHLASLTSLRSLVLTGTGITDTGLERIKSLRSLKELNIYMTHVSPAAVERLKRERPELTIAHAAPLESSLGPKGNVGPRPYRLSPTPLIFPIEPQPTALPSGSAVKPR